MWKDKSPGVKILWLWTIGTAAVLVANVATTRMRDLQMQMNDQDPTTQQVTEPVLIDNSKTDSSEFVREERE